jgi:hypothetical protein
MQKKTNKLPKMQNKQTLLGSVAIDVALDPVAVFWSLPATFAEAFCGGFRELPENSTI